MRIQVLMIVSFLFFGSAFANANTEKAQSLEELLELVKTGKLNEQKANREREQRFLRDKNQQQALLNDTIKSRKAEEDRSTELEALYAENEKTIAELKAALDKRMGSLKELFGHLQSNAGKASSSLETSLVATQIPNREEFLSGLATKVANSTQLPTIAEMEKLWFELLREMRETGRVTKFNRTVLNVDGSESERTVIRVGSFNIVADGQYLQYTPETKTVTELARQPEGNVSSSASKLTAASSGYAAFAVDPSRGAILTLNMQKPNLLERIKQGGLVGYIILTVGALALLVGFYRLIALALVSAKVKAQLKTTEAMDNNPLGRVLSVYDQNRTVDSDTLDMKLTEAILKEKPTLESFQMFLKVVYIAAPLMGLLGTVTGMINTFQAITLFGTGDPKIMAGGISQALMTTVLGLVVAIPTLLMHTVVTSRSKTIVQILTERSAGIIADHIDEAESNEPRQGAA